MIRIPIDSMEKLPELKVDSHSHAICYLNRFRFRRIRSKDAFARFFRVTAKETYPSRISWICCPFSASKLRGILRFSTRSEFTVSAFEIGWTRVGVKCFLRRFRRGSAYRAGGSGPSFAVADSPGIVSGRHAADRRKSHRRSRRRWGRKAVLYGIRARRHSRAGVPFYVSHSHLNLLFDVASPGRVPYLYTYLLCILQFFNK